MKGLYIISYLVALLKIGSPQELGTIEMLDSSTRQVQLGAMVEWTCLYHENIIKVMSSPIEFYHEFIWNGEEKRVFLFSNTNRQDDANPDVWNITMTHDNDNNLLTFKIQLKAATAQHNGRFLCEMGEQSISSDIVVYEDIKEIEMTLHGRSFTDDSNNTMELELADPHDVHCRVLGANPGAEFVQVMVDGKVLDTGDVTIAAMDTATPQYSTKTGTGVILTEKQHEGTEVACEARGPGPNGNMLRASATLAIILRSPVINCSDTDAYLGKKYTFMKCLVDTTGVPGDIKMSVKINSIAKVIEAGKEDTIKGQRIMVDMKQCFEDMPTSKPCATEVPNQFTIITRIAEVQDWHLNTGYTLQVLSKGGHITTGVSHLNRVAAPITTQAPASRSAGGDEGYNAAVSVAASLSLVCVATLMTLLRML